MTYWTGIWDPAREGVSKEVQDLRTELSPRGPVVSFSSGQRSSMLPGDRVLRLSARKFWFLRAIAAAVERTGDLTHVIDRVDSWHLLRVLGRRPLLFTVTTTGAPLPKEQYRHVRMFAAQTPQIADVLLGAGIEPDRVRVVWPGIDLRRFRPAPLPVTAPFRVLFASTPAAIGELDGRGIPLLVEVARRLPDVEVILLWRRWGDIDAARSAVSAMAPTPNLRFQLEDAPDMLRVYQGVHATVCCFEAGFGKSCPTFVAEGLACGRPTVVSDTMAISRLIRSEQAGLVSLRSADDVANAILILRDNASAFASAARSVAERFFDLAAASRNYAAMYREISNPKAN